MSTAFCTVSLSLRSSFLTNSRLASRRISSSSSVFLSSTSKAPLFSKLRLSESTLPPTRCCSSANPSPTTFPPSTQTDSAQRYHVVDRLRHSYDALSVDGEPQPIPVADLVKTAFSFPLDDFQKEALAALSANSSVVLSAPTGAGKTVIGEMAIYLALCRRQRVFYTTPLKALSNQKYYDFKLLFGADRVGLVTGDITHNRDADILIMTTEIYRNMLYAESTEQPSPSGETAGGATNTDSLFAVVFDEFHYLNDRDRGTVWEESVINSPPHVLLVALSATMSNTADIRDWFSSVQGDTVLVQSHVRPVPLNFGYCDQEGVTPLFAEEKSTSSGKGNGFGRRAKPPGKKKNDNRVQKLHPKLLRKLKEAARREERERGRRSKSKSDGERDEQYEKHRAVAAKRERRESVYADIPSFPFVVRNLRRRDMLPCIVFIFSRAGCDRAAVSASHEREELVSKTEQERIRQRMDAFVSTNPGMITQDRYDLALKGIASHHAGLLPLWKLCVEELFQDGLIKVVFATETLAAGINMPARTTVISSLSKRIGEEGFRSLTTSEVLQMAGRAGRRGKDSVGHSIVLRSRKEGAFEAFKILTAGVDALESKFAPTYGMVLNLLLARSLDDAKVLVDRSFGNYLRERNLKLRVSSGDMNSSTTDEEILSLMREKEALELVLADAEAIINSVEEDVLRSFVKSIERVKAEKRALSYLVQQSSEVDSNLIEDTLTFAPTGTRILLREKNTKGSTGAEKRQKRRDYSAALDAAGKGDLGLELRSFFLSHSDVELEELAEEQEKTHEMVEAVLLDLHSESAGLLPMFAAVDAHGELRLFSHTAVSRILYDEETIDVQNTVNGWSEISLPSRSQWRSIGFDQYVAPMPDELNVLVPIVQAWRAERQAAGESTQDHGNGTVGGVETGEVKAQRERVNYAKGLVREHEMFNRADMRDIMAARRAVKKIEAILEGKSDPYGTKRRKRRGRGRGDIEGRYANISGVKYGDEIGMESGQEVDDMAENTSWEEFMAHVQVLQHYGFVDDEHGVTSLGEMGAKVRSENELWTSLVLLEPELNTVSPVHLGAILGATQMDGGRNDAFVEHEVSEVTREIVSRLAPLRMRLLGVQGEYGVYASAGLEAELMGLVELWATGVSWVELLSATSLQEGDAIRILRRTLDVLRQTLHLPVVSDELKRNARRAIALLDRFPVTDDQTYMVADSERDDQ